VIVRKNVGKVREDVGDLKRGAWSDGRDAGVEGELMRLRR